MGELSYFSKSSWIAAVPKHECLLASPGGLIKWQRAGPTPRVPSSVGVGQGPSMRTLKNLAGEATRWWITL